MTDQMNMDQLDEESMLQLGEKLAGLWQRLERLKGEKREAAKDLNDQIKACEKSIEATAAEYDRQMQGHRALQAKGGSDGPEDA